MDVFKFKLWLTRRRRIIPFKKLTFFTFPAFWGIHHYHSSLSYSIHEKNHEKNEKNNKLYETGNVTVSFSAMATDSIIKISKLPGAATRPHPFCRRTSEHIWGQSPESQADQRPSVHREAHLPLTFPLKNYFERVHNLNVDIFMLQPIPSVDDPHHHHHHWQILMLKTSMEV